MGGEGVKRTPATQMEIQKRGHENNILGGETTPKKVGNPSFASFPANFIRHGTAHAEFNCAGEARAILMKPLSWQEMSGSGDNFYENPRQTSIDKLNDPVMKSERIALVRGSDPP